MDIEIKLKQLLKEKNLKQYEIAEKTGLTTRTISELVNNQVERIPKKALIKIAVALEVTDIRELIDFKHNSE